MTEQLQRARVVKALRESKRRRAQEQEETERLERETAKGEMKLMFAEDTRYHCVLEKQRKRNSVHAGKVCVLPSQQPPKDTRLRPASAALSRKGANARDTGENVAVEGVATAIDVGGESHMPTKPAIPKTLMTGLRMQKKPSEPTDEEREAKRREEEAQAKEKARRLVSGWVMCCVCR